MSFENLILIMKKAKYFNVVMLSTAEWDNPFWTNKQHTASALADLGYRVLYIESLGLRRPTIHSRDGFRIVKRLIKAFTSPKPVRKNIWVWSPLVIPSSSNCIARSLNKFIFTISLSLIRFVLNFRSSVLWTYNPLTRIYLELSEFVATIYHCVDEISEQPGMNSQFIQLEEKNLCSLVDHVFVTSTTLLQSRSALTSRISYYPNVVDNSHFSESNAKLSPFPEEYQHINGPRLLFVGAISSYKVDFDLIRNVALSRPNWSIVLIGLIGEGDPGTDISLLKNLKNVYFLGPKSYKMLPSYIYHAHVGLLPCLINSYTKSMFPMKFFEYLSVGIPVVSTRLPSLVDFEQCFLSADSTPEFIDCIQLALDNKSIIDFNHVKGITARYTYISRTLEMTSTIKNILSRKFGFA